MKPGFITGGRALIVVSVAAITLALVSWQDKQTPAGQTNTRTATDTVPQKKQVNRHPRDLDEAIEELDNVDLSREISNAMLEMKNAMKEVDMVKVQQQVDKAMKQVDMTKIQAEVAQAMKEVDMTKIQAEIAEAMKSVDGDKLKKEIETAMASIDWNEIKAQVEKVKEINLDKLDIDMKNVQEELLKIEPEVKKSLESAKVEIEKAKAEMKDYKTLVDGLDNDGLLNKKETYTLKHEDGKLFVNGKEAPASIYQKYRTILEKHPSFTLKKDTDSFSIDKD